MTVLVKLTAVFFRYGGAGGCTNASGWSVHRQGSGTGHGLLTAASATHDGQRLAVVRVRHDQVETNARARYRLPQHTPVGFPLNKSS